ncbi:hypothetical protein POHY109586_22115 [Polaromonas hydrogenivorans]
MASQRRSGAATDAGACFFPDALVIESFKRMVCAPTYRRDGLGLENNTRLVEATASWRFAPDAARHALRSARQFSQKSTAPDALRRGPWPPPCAGASSDKAVCMHARRCAPANRLAAPADLHAATPVNSKVNRARQPAGLAPVLGHCARGFPSERAVRLRSRDGPSAQYSRPTVPSNSLDLSKMASAPSSVARRRMSEVA